MLADLSPSVNVPMRVSDGARRTGRRSPVSPRRSSSESVPVPRAPQRPTDGEHQPKISRAIFNACFHFILVEVPVFLTHTSFIKIQFKLIKPSDSFEGERARASSRSRAASRCWVEAHTWQPAASLNNMLSAGRALGIAARMPRASGGGRGGAGSIYSYSVRRPTAVLRRRTSVAASPRFLAPGAGTAAVAAALRPLALPCAAIVAAAGAAGFYIKRREATGVLGVDLTAPPPPQQLALALSATEEQQGGAVRRVAEALLRWVEAVYQQARILLRLAEITLVASPCLATYPIAARCVGVD